MIVYNCTKSMYMTNMSRKCGRRHARRFDYDSIATKLYNHYAIMMVTIVTTTMN